MARPLTPSRLVLASVACLAWGCHPDGSSGTNDELIPARRGLFPFPERTAIGPGGGYALARGDLNEDGIDDLALAMQLHPFQGENHVRLILQGRGGRVLEQRMLGGTRLPIALSIADLNADGSADLAVLDSIGEIAVYLQTSPGSFSDPVPYSVGDRPTQLLAGDFDDDGALDYLTANSLGADVSVLLGRNDGTFEPARFSPSPAGGPADVGDVNLDGKLDLAVAGYSSLAVQLGLGNGRFGPPLSLPAGDSMQGVRIAEVSGDGFPDIVRSAVNDRQLVVLEGDGTGNFTSGYTFFVGNPVLGALEVADLDGNDVPDIVLTSSAGIHPLMGLGGGTFEPRAVYATGGYLGSFLVADDDGDGNLDVLTSTLEFIDFDLVESFRVVLNGRGNGTFDGPCVYPAEEEASTIVLGDFVVDGVMDAALFGRYPAYVAVLPGAADGSFGAPLRMDLPAPPGGLAVGDVDGNTLDDLIVLEDSFGPGVLSLLSSQGNGSFDAPVQVPAGGVSPQSLRQADLDGNFVLDLVVANRSSNQIAVHLGDPGGSFRKPLRFGTGFSPQALVLEDFDGDGRLDVAASNLFDQSVSVLLGNGDGTFQPDTAHGVLSEPYGLAAGDIEGDGDLDLAVGCAAYNGGEPGLGFLYGRGDGTFEPFVKREGVGATFEVALADLNGDGMLDLVHRSFSEVSVALRRGGAFAQPSVYASSYLGGFVVHDVNHDQRPDLLVTQGSSQGQLLVFPNQGPPGP